MPLRVGFDLDGTLADFEGAFHDIDVRLFGKDAHTKAGQPEKETEEPPREGEQRKAEDRRASKRLPVHGRRRRDRIWDTIRRTPDFWNTLRPLDPAAVTRIHEMSLRHRWEVFFITQRPWTEGDTVQRQTQRWLIAQGFDMPSVLVIGGSRGAAAGALRLDYLVDDSPQNCLDVLADSRAKPILVAPGGATTAANARKLGIATVPGIAAALDLLERVSADRAQPGALAKLAAMIGWK